MFTHITLVGSQIFISRPWYYLLLQTYIWLLQLQMEERQAVGAAAAAAEVSMQSKDWNPLHLWWPLAWRSASESSPRDRCEAHDEATETETRTAIVGTHLACILMCKCDCMARTAGPARESLRLNAKRIEIVNIVLKLQHIRGQLGHQLNCSGE